MLIGLLCLIVPAVIVVSASVLATRRDRQWRGNDE